MCPYTNKNYEYTESYDGMHAISIEQKHDLTQLSTVCDKTYDFIICKINKKSLSCIKVSNFLMRLLYIDDSVHILTEIQQNLMSLKSHEKICYN